MHILVFSENFFTHICSFSGVLKIAVLLSLIRDAVV